MHWVAILASGCTFSWVQNIFNSQIFACLGNWRKKYINTCCIYFKHNLKKPISMDTRACQQRIPLSTDGTDRCVKKLMQIIWMQFVFYSCFSSWEIPFGWKKQTATRQLVIYLLEAFLQLERPMCYCLLSLLLFVMNL